VSTSALLLGVPWALAYSEEQMMVEQERQELMAQRAQNEVCLDRERVDHATTADNGLQFMVPGAPVPGQPQGAKPAL
jgi:import receptor subunit TOM22